MGARLCLARKLFMRSNHVTRLRAAARRQERAVLLRCVVARPCYMERESSASQDGEPRKLVTVCNWRARGCGYREFVASTIVMRRRPRHCDDRSFAIGRTVSDCPRDAETVAPGLLFTPRRHAASAT